MNNRREDEMSEPRGAAAHQVVPLADAQRAMAEELLMRARESGLDLVGRDGVLAALTKQVIEAALDAEMTEHLGHEHGGLPTSSNVRNGSYPKTVQTDVGPVQVRVPRDRDGGFEPQIVRKHQRRLDGFDDNVLSLYAKGLTTGEIRDHLEEVYDAHVSRDTISRVTDKIVDELREWRNRPLDDVWPVVFIDALYVKIRDGQVAKKPVYVALGVNLQGEKDVLGLWVGDGGEGAKHWAQVLSELANRGVTDIWLLCCDGLKGLPDAVGGVFPRTEVQTCVVHLMRNTFRYSSQGDWGKLSTGMRRIYTAATVDEALEMRDEFFDRWDERYPAVTKLWSDAWEEFTPFLKFPPGLRRLVYTTNVIESLNARFRRATRVRGHFPTDEAALKVLYLTVMRRDAKGRNPIGKIKAWKQAMNELKVHYPDRMP